MKLCDTCIYRNNVEQLKPCIVYRDDCEHYESEEDMSEVGVEIVKTEETEKSGIKYLNINVSNSEVERNPDIVRLCADAGILEYVKPKTGHWIEHPEKETSTPEYLMFYECSECGNKQCFWKSDIHKKRFCSNCGCRMVETQESEDLGDYPDAIQNQFDNMTGSMNL